MVSYLARLAALAAVVASGVFAAPTAESHFKIRNAAAKNVIPDSYIVVYHENVNTTMIASHMSAVTSMLSRRDLPGVGAIYNLGSFKGYQVTANAASIVEIRYFSRSKFLPFVLTTKN
jgi:hypothetical protein